MDKRLQIAKSGDDLIIMLEGVPDLGLYSSTVYGAGTGTPEGTIALVESWGWDMCDDGFFRPSRGAIKTIVGEGSVLRVLHYTHADHPWRYEPGYYWSPLGGDGSGPYSLARDTLGEALEAALRYDREQWVKKMKKRSPECLTGPVHGGTMPLDGQQSRHPIPPLLLQPKR